MSTPLEWRTASDGSVTSWWMNTRMSMLARKKLITAFCINVRKLFSWSETTISRVYASRGADVNDILEFNKRYPKCSIRPLLRTSAARNRSSRLLIRSPPRPWAKPVSEEPDSRPPTLYRRISGYSGFPDRKTEAEWVANRIDELLGTAYVDDSAIRGSDPSPVCRLDALHAGDGAGDMPRHSAFTEAIEGLDIPISSEAGGGPFDRPQTVVLRSYFFELLPRPASCATYCSTTFHR